MSTNKRINEIDKEIEKLQKEKQNIIDSEKVVYSVEVDRYLNTYTGKRLLDHHKMDDEGTWEIFGEDPNCDMGDSHHQPHLATVSGKLIKAIEYATSLSGFYTGGSGGNIRKTNVVKV